MAGGHSPACWSDPSALLHPVPHPLLQKGAGRQTKKASLNAKKPHLLHLSIHWAGDLILEEIRLVKQDFLDVNTLTVPDGCVVLLTTFDGTQSLSPP